MNKKIKIGIIGYGSFRKFFHATLSSIEYDQVNTIAYVRSNKGMTNQVIFYHY